MNASHKPWLQTFHISSTYLEGLSLISHSPTINNAMIRTTDFRGRFVVLALLAFAICGFVLYQAPLSHLSLPQQYGQSHTIGAQLTGHAIAPKLGNATAKYVCGNYDAPVRPLGAEARELD
jgi:hypothetical protein